MPRVRLLFVVVWSLGCRDDPSPSFVVGDVCASPASYCETWESVVRCTDGRWKRIECASACGGATMGCLLRGSSDSMSKAACLCADDTLAPQPEAEEGSTGVVDACLDSETLIECDTGDCKEYPCAELCAQQADFPTALGCRANACECSAIGAPCDSDEPARCEPVESLVACVDGEWTATDCRRECRSASAVCGYDETQKAVCGCGG